MAKTKFFRVAVEGATVDGRTIDRAMLEQMAASYNTDTYTARINIEHLRGYSPEPPFNAYGSVAALKVQEDEIELGGKKEKRLALYASFEINDQAKSVNEAGQKLFSSVEINPDFAGSKKAYLVGIAFTDSPASLGTEILKFSTRDDARKANYIAVSDFELAFEDEASAAQSEVTSAFAAMKNFFTGLAAPKQEAQVITPPAQTEQPPTHTELTAFAKVMGEGLEKLSAAFASATAQSDVRIAKLSEDLGKLKADIEKTTPGTYTARPAATGGGDRVLADC